MARDFNGTNQGAEAASVDLSAVNKATVSLWLKVADWGAAAHFDKILTHTDNPDTSHTGFQIFADADGAHFQVQLTGDVGDNNAQYAFPSTGVYHHYAFIFDTSQAANEVDYYLDGTLQTPTSRPSTANNTNNFSQSTFHLMSLNETSDWKSGNLADVAVWNLLLTGANISNLASGSILPSDLATGLKGYWKLCGDVSPEPDSSSANNNLVLTGAPPKIAHPATISGSCGSVENRRITITRSS